MREVLAVVGLAVMLVLALFAPSISLTTAASTDGDSLTLDTSEVPLNTDSKVNEFENNGVASGDVSAPQMTLIVAKDRGDVELGYTANPLKSSTRNDFIRVEHHEDMERTVTIPIRNEYWDPFPRENLDSLTSDHTADMEPMTVNGVEYTFLTVSFTGAESAVFPVPEDAVAVYKATKRTDERANSTFGIDLGLAPTPWEYIDSDAFSGNNTAVRIEGDPDTMMIQYDANTGKEESDWLEVPDKQRRNKPVYRMTKDGVDDAVYVVSAANESVDLRYKEGTAWGDRVSAWVRDARRLPSRIFEDLGLSSPSLVFALVPVGMSISRRGEESEVSD